ncbi:predicted protein [Streptomyces filamentosus NRRL 15998]|uniref:Predicted protein n=1 Tax=Streptomyces filamentosus NRRL 15998 TaxID=457431 RepID=D6ARB9_STRFL|nr:predicted protein [Streptomyces filamentosus NRRL 15998]
MGRGRSGAGGMGSGHHGGGRGVPDTAQGLTGETGWTSCGDWSGGVARTVLAAGPRGPAALDPGAHGDG